MSQRTISVPQATRAPQGRTVVVAVATPRRTGEAGFRGPPRSRTPQRRQAPRGTKAKIIGGSACIALFVAFLLRGGHVHVDVDMSPGTVTQAGEVKRN